MATPQQKPWAILLCKYTDDANDPSVTRIMDLYAQWERENGSRWISGNLDPSSATDSRSILDVYGMFFTTQGLGTFNAVRYWDEMSHGRIDISGSLVFRCTLERTGTQAEQLFSAYEAADPVRGGAKYQEDTFRLAKKALSEQHGVDWRNYGGGVAVSFQSPDRGAQGGTFDGGPGVFMDVRYVLSSGIQAWGQEMGHAFGLDHSRKNGIPSGPDGKGADYTDLLDVMSTRYAKSGPDPNYGKRGPGINAWNMRGRGWLDETRVWHSPDGSFDQTLQLRPLHRKDLAGFLAAELPPLNDTDGFPRFLVEYRKKEDWDNGIPRSCISVHRFEGPIEQFTDTHSYVMPGTKGQELLVAGDRFAAVGTMGPQLSVIKVDDANSTATIRLTALQPVVAFQANTGHLWTVGGDDRGDWGLGMMAGTSPSIIVLPGGGYEVAFQANTGNLWTVGEDDHGEWDAGMMAGTSPSIIALPGGGYEVAFQANTGKLWTLSAGDTGFRMMAGTSPSIIVLPGGGYEVAFQANTGNLWTIGDEQYGDRDWDLGMMAGTSPSIAALPGGGYELAFQANTGNLWTIGAGDTGFGIMAGTSPRIAG